MPSLPIPFFVAFLLLILLARYARRGDGTPASRPVLALIGLCALQSLLVGLRWGYDVQALQLVMPVVAATLPPLVYVSFGELSRTGSERNGGAPWHHALPPLLLVVLVVFWRGAIDLVLAAVHLGYALLLLRLARRGPDALSAAVFEGVVPVHRALQTAGVVLLASPLVDALVALDVQRSGGARAATIVGLASVLQLFLLGLAAAFAGAGRPAEEDRASAPSGPRIDSEEDEAVVARVDALIRAQELFRDADLNLNRLARRAGLPARRISAAINRVHGKNVSQYINGYRIAEACRLLEAGDRQVTQIMFEAGFQTKSNFNREFRRVTGMSPLEWRARESERA